MPQFLEKKLKKEYGSNKKAIYGTMNKIGAMKGNKETAKGKMMTKKHSRDMKKSPSMAMVKKSISKSKGY